MSIITSVNNQEIIAIAKLSAPKERKLQQRFIAEGLRTCATMIQNGMQPEQIYVTQEHRAAAEELIGFELVTLVPDDVMKKISQTITPSGFLGVFPLPQQPPLSAIDAGLVLYELADPGNVGTLIRTAAAMNKKTVVIIGGTDPYNPKVVQATAGAIAMVTIFKISWEELYKNHNNLDLCALVVADGQPIETIDGARSLLIVGSEAHGLPVHILNQCTKKITLAMPGNTESLNAGVAGSIAAYVAWHGNKA